MSEPNALQQGADITFLAITLFREARGEISRGRLALAFSVMNRVHKPSWWGRDVQSVLFKRWQYSSLTAPHDPQLAIWPANSADPIWQECLLEASQAYAGTPGLNPAPNADSYFDDSIAPPAWAKPALFVAKIGRLNFYNLDRDHEAEALAVAKK